MKYYIFFYLFFLSFFSYSYDTVSFEKKFIDREKKLLKEKDVSLHISFYKDCIHCVKSANFYYFFIYKKNNKFYFEFYILDKEQGESFDTLCTLSNNEGQSLLEYLDQNFETLKPYEDLFYTENFEEKIDSNFVDGKVSYSVVNSNRLDFGPHIVIRTKDSRKRMLELEFMTSSDMYYLLDYYPRLGGLMLLINQIYHRRAPIGNFSLMIN